MILIYVLTANTFFILHLQIGSPDLVVLLACSNQQLRQRLEKRAALQGRPDDNAHAIERRLETFKQNITLIAKYYQERGLIVRVILTYSTAHFFSIRLIILLFKAVSRESW